MKQLASLSMAQIRGYFRDRTTLFFTFFLPLIFLGIFGLVSSNSNVSKTEVGIVGNGPLISALPKDVLKFENYKDEATAREAVRKGDSPGAFIESGNNVTLVYATTDATSAGILQGIATSVINSANLQAAGVTSPAYQLNATAVESEDLKPIEQLTPGIVSWAIATSACFGAALTFISWRDKQLLRRLRLAPMPTFTLICSRLAVAILIAIIQAAVFFAIAAVAFDFTLKPNILLYLPILICGVLAFVAIGQLIGSIAKTVDSGSAIANLVVLPMAFVCGVFMPASMFPPIVQTIGKFLPLYHINEGTIDVMIRGEGVSSMLNACWPLLAFALVIGAIATKAFRWEK